MHRLWPILLIPALAIASCWEEPGIKNNTTIEYNYPCDYHFRSPDPDFFHSFYLEWTPDGSHLIFNGSLRTMWTVNAEGTSARMLVDVNPGRPVMYSFYADVSPDGFRIVYSTCEFALRESNDHYEIAILEQHSGRRQRLMHDTLLDHYPVWSPDGAQIAFLRVPVNDSNALRARLYTMAADGSDVRNVVPTLPILSQSQIRLIGEEDTAILKLRGVALYPPAWSPNGEKLAFLVYEGEFFPFRTLLYTVRKDGTELTRIAEDVVSVASWSPDGQRLAVAKYSGDDIGIFTLAADGSDPKLVTTIIERETSESRDPRYRFLIHTVSWSPDSTQILYSCDGGACVVNVEDGRITGLVNGLKGWDKLPYLAAWSPDGARVTIYKPDAGQLFTVARDGTNRRDLIRLDANGNLVPANPPRQSE